MAALPETLPTALRMKPRLAKAIRRPLIGPNTPLMRALVEHAKLELVPMKNLDAAIAALAPHSSVSMTCSPAKTIEDTLDATAVLVAAGHHVSPHISARMVQTPAHLAEIVSRLAEIGTREIFVVGGDADPPGCFFDAIEFLEALLELDPAIDHIGFPAYPDTHPLISNEELHRALHTKQAMILDSGRTAHVSTQLCFSAEQIRQWLRTERSAGLTIPVHLGVAGVVDRTKLMTMGVRLGVGTSLRYLSKNRKAIGKMMTQRAFQPDQLLRPLAGDLAELGIGGLHLYTFNQVATTEAWRQRTLGRA
jgi:methylenetetrahydrofolate reductase (NADPH)